jgi:hypothetical protein
MVAHSGFILVSRRLAEASLEALPPATEENPASE